MGCDPTVLRAVAVKVHRLKGGMSRGRDLSRGGSMVGRMLAARRDAANTDRTVRNLDALLASACLNEPIRKKSNSYLRVMQRTNSALQKLKEVKKKASDLLTRLSAKKEKGLLDESTLAAEKYAPERVLELVDELETKSKMAQESGDDLLMRKVRIGIEILFGHIKSNLMLDRNYPENEPLIKAAIAETKARRTDIVVADVREALAAA